MPDAKKGDSVLFHFDSGGQRFVREAIVLYVWGEKEAPPEQELMCLEVDFVEEDFKHGTPSRLQAHVPRGTEPTPQSGTWTPSKRGAAKRGN